VLDASPRRLAAFSLAVDQPEAATAALDRLPDGDRARPRLGARLAWREGRLTDAIQTLEDAPGIRARHLRTHLTAERSVLRGDSMIMGRSDQIRPTLTHDHESTRILHLVNDALPSASAGYTIRTHEIVLAQKAAGLDPHVVTRCGFPVTQGTLDGRHLRNQMLFFSARTMEYAFRVFADQLTCDDSGRIELFDALQRWVVCDYRIDPTMDPEDPDAKRLVH